MKNVIVDGTTYTGVRTVQLDTTEGTPALFIDEDEAGGGIMVGSASGKVIHVDNAVADGVKSLKVYDSSGKEVTNAVMLAITNKNLFRTDLLNANTVDKGITFSKRNDGGVDVSGTSTGNYAAVSITLDPKIFQVGKIYTLSSGKKEGEVYIKLEITYSDESAETIYSKNMYAVFTPTKAVTAATAKIEVAAYGTTINEQEVLYPMLEMAGAPSEFEKNVYTTTIYDGTTMPVLPGAVANLWSLANTVSTITMVYNQNIEMQARYLQSQNNENAEIVLNLNQKIDEVSPGVKAQEETLVFLSGAFSVTGETLNIR